jgi:hypothetical protein
MVSKNAPAVPPSVCRFLQQNLPIGDVAASSIHELFDHLVGATEQRQWKWEAQRFCGFQVYYKIDLRGLLDRQIGWFCALQNSASIA